MEIVYIVVRPPIKMFPFHVHLKYIAKIQRRDEPRQVEWGPQNAAGKQDGSVDMSQLGELPSAEQINWYRSDRANEESV